jgi:hypothetical protein
VPLDDPVRILTGVEAALRLGDRLLAPARDDGRGERVKALHAPIVTATKGSFLYTGSKPW